MDINFSKDIVSFLKTKMESSDGLGMRDFYERNGVFLKGHFVGNKGGHMKIYVNIKKVLEDVDHLTALALQMAFSLREIEADVFLAAPYGAQDLPPLVAMFYRVLTRRPVSVLKLVKKRAKGEDKEKIVWYKEHARKVYGKRVVLIDDVINSGGSLMDGKKLIKEAVGALVACAVAFSRKDQEELKKLEWSLQAKIFALHVAKINEFKVIPGQDPRAQCELCRKNIPISQTIGHGKEFLDKLIEDHPLMRKWIQMMRGD